jgi:hypothetical protein
MATYFRDLVNENILKLNPLATVYIAIFQAASRAVVGETDTIIYVPWGSFGRVIVVAETPYEPDEMGNIGPRGIRYYVASAAPDNEIAMRFLLYVASIVHTYSQLSANAMAFPLQLRLMTIWGDGVVPFRELLFEPEVSHPIDSRVLDVVPTQNLWSLGWRAEEERLGRSAVQYELALRRIQNNETLMGFAHLWMGIEALTKAVIRYECKARNIDEPGLGQHLGLNPKHPKFGRDVGAEIRRQIIFSGDAATYKAMKEFSDGLEHGYATWEELWSVPEAVFSATARHLRSTILRVLEAPDDVQRRLLGQPFQDPIESGPRIAFEASARVSQIDLRAADFRIARVRRTMTASTFDSDRGEYHYGYKLEADPEVQG